MIPAAESPESWGLHGSHLSSTSTGAWLDAELGSLEAESTPYMQQTVIFSLFWHFSIWTSIDLFSNLSYGSSTAGSDHPGQPSLPTYVNGPWPCHHANAVTFTDHLIDSDRHGLGTRHNSCSEGGGLTQSSSPAVPNPRAADPNPNPGARMKRRSVLLLCYYHGLKVLPDGCTLEVIVSSSEFWSRLKWLELESLFWFLHTTSPTNW